MSDSFGDPSTKALLIGDTGTGKTGSLASLVHAGYNLRILDLDNGSDILTNMLTDLASPYKMNGSLQIHKLTEHMRVVAGRIIPAKATVWPKMVGLLEKWPTPGKEETTSVLSWTPREVLVLDSFSAASNAALNFHQQMNARLGAPPQGNEWRRDIGATQAMLESLLQMLTDAAIQCNVLVLAHVVYVDEQTGQPVLPDEAVPQKGYPSAIGRALSPKIGRYFNNCLYTKAIGSGSGARCKIYTRTQGAIGLKTSAPLRVKPEYDLGSGLAQFFADVKGQTAKSA